tara:strand:- start:2920 stop:3213 length:294 start_codon:yes stop_codon:yes gene_type:complete
MINRYRRAPKIRGGNAYGSYEAGNVIFRAVQQGALDVEVMTLTESKRLDHLAGQYYGDGSLWWVISSASKIGWGLQVPAGTRIVIPVDLGQISALVG